MSLEETMASLGEQIALLTAEMKTQNATLTAMRDGPKSAPKADAKPAAAKADAKPAASKPAAAKPAAKATTVDDLLKVAGAYLQGTTDKEERNLLVGTVRPILEHFGVPKVSEIEVDNVDEAIGYLTKLKEAYDAADEGEQVSAAQKVNLGLSNESEPPEEDVL